MQRMGVAAEAVHKIFQDLKYGEMMVHVFKYLQDRQQQILELSQISSKLKREAFQHTFNERDEELNKFRKFVDSTNRFWNIFRFTVPIKGTCIRYPHIFIHKFE